MTDEVRILVTGGSGQLGRELVRATWPEGVKVEAPTRDRLDLSTPITLRSVLAEGAYSAVINAGAYTAVDAAESDAGMAFQINALAPAALAQLTRAAGIPLVQVSTDYVFDGSGSRPYGEDSPIAPINVYGASKAAGELAVAAGNRRSAIVRTAWVVSPHGRNFVGTMLSLAKTRDVVRVVADQRGAPTSARDLADALSHLTLTLIRDPNAETGAFHFTNSGEASWAEVAALVFGISRAHGGPWAEVQPISTGEYPTPARRPAYSVLANQRIVGAYGLASRPWTDAVTEVVEAMLEGDKV